MYNQVVRITALLISIFLYLKIDEKYRTTNKLNSIFKINRQWKAYILSAIVFISGVIISIFIKLMDSTPHILTSIGAGIILGLTTCLSEKIVTEVKLVIK